MAGAVEIVWSEQALADLLAVRDFIARTSARYATVVIARIVEAIERLEQFPESGRVVPELGEPSVREVLHGPYRILYETQGSQRVEILAIIHASRRFPPSE